MFQIKYQGGWIMVDVSGDIELLGEEGFSKEAFQQSVDALLGANLIIVTHEHHDHVWRLINGPNVEKFTKKTILTKEQIHKLITSPNQPEVKLTKEEAEKFTILGYSPLPLVSFLLSRQVTRLEVNRFIYGWTLDKK